MTTIDSEIIDNVEIDTIAKAMDALGSEIEAIFAKDGGMSGEDAERLERMTAEYRFRSDQMEGAGRKAFATASERYTGRELDSRGDALEVRSGATGIVNPSGGMTLGEAFVKSPVIQEWLSHRRDIDGMLPEGVGASPQVYLAAPLSAKASFQNAQEDESVPASFKGANVKNLVYAQATTGTNVFNQSTRLPGFTDLVPNKTDLFMRNICTNLTLPGDGSWEYTTITGKTNNAGVVPEAESAAPLGDPNAGPSGGVVDTIIGGYKPESSMDFQKVTGRVETIAHHIPITRNASMDAAGIMQEINEFLFTGIREKEEQQFLFGTGAMSPPELQGLLNTTNPYGIQTLSAGAATDIDIILLAMAQVRNAYHSPNWIIVNPDDYYNGLLLAKDADGNYQLGNPRASADQIATLWGLGVLVTQSIPQGTMVVGDFRQALVADRMRTTLYMSDSHGDRFVRNILTLLAEERVGFGCRVPEAFVMITP